MFKNITIYSFSLPAGIEPNALGEALSRNVFTPCGATQQQSVGWVAPRHDGVFVEAIKSQLILKLMIETKKVPSDILDRELQAQIKNIEVTTGRKPGKEERRELKEDIVLSLLPQAFPQRKSAFVWIDREYSRIIVGSTSSAMVDTVLTELVKALDGIAIYPVETEESPVSAMSSWLTADDYPEKFIGERELELKAIDESKAVVKYKNHAIDIDEVQDHILQGKVPTKLGMSFNDRIAFTLTPELRIKGISILELAFEDADPEAEAFEADVLIQTAEIGALLDELFSALGGVTTQE